MTSRRIIALTAAGVTALAGFVLGLALIYSANYTSSSERLFFVSLSIGPVAMCATMVGYGVWWITMFLLTLFSPGREGGEEK